jgi:hypothetical protein
MQQNPYRRQPNINDMMYPKGSRQPRQVWGAVMNVPRETSVPDVSPTPTPSITPTITPTETPTNTPTPTLTPTPTEPQGFKLQAENSDFIQAENGNNINIEH